MAGEYTDGTGQTIHHHGSGTIPALADEELMGEDDEYDDLYSDVNISENFFQAHNMQMPAPAGNTGNGTFEDPKHDTPAPIVPTGTSQASNIPGGLFEGKYPNSDGNLISVKPQSAVYPASSSVGIKGIPSDVQVQNLVSQVPNSAAINPPDMPRRAAGEPSYPTTPHGVQQTPVNQVNMIPHANHAMVNKNPAHLPVENGNTMLFIGELHWWTTDAELENVLSQYGSVKEIKFFDERVSGKSKGYCQVEFYDAAVAAACKDSMNGYVFNGRACVVAFASQDTLKQMGSSFVGRNQGQNQTQNRRPLNQGMDRGGNSNMQGGDGGRNYGRGGFGRGGQGMSNRGGPWSGGQMRGRGPNNMGNNVGAGPYGVGLGGHAFGGGMMHPQGMMHAGFDPTYMGRGGGYGGFSGLAYPGMASSFPGVNPMGMVGVAPHVNPAFFGGGMGNNGLGMMGSSSMEGQHSGMWSEPSGYGGEDGGSEYGYGDENQEKDVKPNLASRKKEQGSEHELSGNTDRRHRDEREHKDYRYHEEKDRDRNRDHRGRERDYDDDRDRGQSSSRSRSRSRMMEDDHRARSKDGDYGKRRRPSD